MSIPSSIPTTELPSYLNIPNLKPYLLYFIQEDLQHYGDFRLSELLSLSELYSINYTFFDSNKYNKYIPFLIIYLKNEEILLNILSRSIMIRCAYELWAHQDTVENLIDDLKVLNYEQYSNYLSEDKSFCIKVDSFGKVTKQEEKIKLMKLLNFMPWKGPIHLKKPDVGYSLLLDYQVHLTHVREFDVLLNVYFGRYIGDGCREAINKYSLKQRKFLSPTSTDSCLSLLMANEAQITKKSLIIDPFVGSGSLLVAATHFGATCMGSDIDYFMVKGKNKLSMRINFDQYNLPHPDILRADQSRSPLRANFKFDAIICDPPYGIRAGAKKVATLDSAHIIPNEKLYIDQVDGTIRPHIQQLVRYEVQDVMIDLMEFAANRLVLNGKLVYLYPTTRSYKDSDLPSHPCLRVTHNSEQYLQGEFCRRLITMVKFQECTPDMKAFVLVSDAAHLDLHSKYYKIGDFKDESKDEVVEKCSKKAKNI